MLQITDTEGNTVQLYPSMQQVENGFLEQGIAPEKLGHLGLSVHHPGRTTDFYLGGHPGLAAETPLSLQTIIGMSDQQISEQARIILRALAVMYR